MQNGSSKVQVSSEDSVSPSAESSNVSSHSTLACIACSVYTSTDENTIWLNTHRQKLAVLYGMMPGESIVAKGQFGVTVVKGAVRMYGAVIPATKLNEKSHYVCVPEGSASPEIESVPSEAANMRFGTVPDEFESEYTRLMEKYPTVIRLDAWLTGLENISNIAPVYGRMWGAPDEMTKSRAAFETIFARGSKSQQQGILKFSFKGSWYEAASDINDTKSPTGTYVAMVVGNKGSGKSTFCTFVTNHLTSKNTNSAYYLELDPGQPDAGCPGSLSLFQKTAPSFSPAFAFDMPKEGKRLVKSHSLGATTPMDSPEYFLRCAKDLMTVFKRDQEENSNTKRSVLVVNTPGWTKGLGVDLLHNIAKICKPNIVVSVGEVIPELDAKFESFQRVSIDGQVLDPNYNVFDKEKDKTRIDLTAADTRAVRLMTYFHQEDSFTVHLASKTPRSVPYNDTNNAYSIRAVAMIGGEGMAIEDAGRALNATLVAVVAVNRDFLATIKVDRHESESIPWMPASSVDKLLGDPSQMRCLGYAMIQSIDNVNKCFRLVSPIATSDLIQAISSNSSLVLLRGRLSLPIWDMWQPGTDATHVPYLSEKAIAEGGDVLKVRRNILR